MLDWKSRDLVLGPNLSLTSCETRDKSLLLRGPLFCQWQNEVKTQMTSKVIAELTTNLNVLFSSIKRFVLPLI